LDYSDIFLRLFLALMLGLILGVERTLAGKVAGMRTYGLVSLGSALFVLVPQLVIRDFPGTNPAESFRIAAQILVGIGFLGAGLVVMKGNKVTGLTTAAGLWVTAAVGMTVGYGYYNVALFAAGLTLFVFTILWIIERDYVEKIHDKIDSKEE